MSVEDDFYIGYQTSAPRALGRFLRWTVAALVVGAASLGAVLVAVQDRFDPGTFEFGVVRSFEGVIAERPYPLLVVDRPAGEGDHAASRFFLVAFGKRGAEEEVSGLDGRRVKLEGSLVYREGETMIEVVSGSVEPLEGAEKAPGASRRVALGTHTLRGEIVDSKCFLGVMKPGRGKPHRACAVRCISGGIPPVLRVETQDGDFRHFLLVDTAGRAVNNRVLDLVAEPVEVTGGVTKDGDLLILAADPERIRRL